MEGMSKKKPEELVSLARSWLQAPDIKAISGCQSLGYIKSKREYSLIAEGKTIVVSIDASEQQPIVNVCFAVQNWAPGPKATVLVNDTAAKEVRIGAFVDENGTDNVLIWIELEANAPTKFTIK